MGPRLENQKRHASSEFGCAHLHALSKAKRTKLIRNVWNCSAFMKHAVGLSSHENRGLHCLACGTVSPSPEVHKASHKKSIAGHEILIHGGTGEVFCAACGDFIYSAEIDRAVTAMLTKQHHRPEAAMPTLREQPAGSQLDDAGKVAEDPQDVEPAVVPVAGDVGMCPPGMVPTAAPDGYPAGLRGLNNMGHTCFMNAILQSLLRAPVVKEHILSGVHVPGECEVANGGGYCVPCELGVIFSGAYGGARTPYSPAAFLNAWWMLAGGALGGGCKQQDAHEFFLFVLEMLAAGHGYDSMVQRAFRGVMQSDVVCSVCGTASSTQDDFTHISVDIPPLARLLAAPILPRPNANSANSKGGAAAAVGKTGPHLVGAAKKAHLARLEREKAAPASATPAPPTTHARMGLPTIRTRDCSETTPERSSEIAAAPDARGTDPYSCEIASSTVLGVGAGARRLTPPVDFDQASVDGLTGMVAQNGEESAMDTLSSPGRPVSTRARTIDREAQANDDALDAVAAETNIMGSETIKSLVESTTAPHPALAAFSRWPGVSLIGCLRRFVWPELLNPSEQIACPCCGQSSGALKQLSFVRLPPVLVLHTKRFEHTGGPRATAKKLDTHLSFPMDDLDMAPFLTSKAMMARHIARKRPFVPGTFSTPSTSPPLSMTKSKTTTIKGSLFPLTRLTRRQTTRTAPMRSTPSSAVSPGAASNAFAEALNSTAQALPVAQGTLGSQESKQPVQRPLYDLFAVVCHSGNFSGGHYITYVRADDRKWYVCDDAYVVPVSEETVKNCQAYMLFYGQKEASPSNAELCNK